MGEKKIVAKKGIKMQRKRGFTIVELMITVVIIGVLATLAIPQFANAVEKTKAAKAKHNLALMYKSMSMCGEDIYAGNGNYLSDKCDSDSERGAYVQYKSGSDESWTYSFSSVTSSGFVAMARRRSGAYTNCEISIDENQKFSKSGSCAANII